MFKQTMCKTRLKYYEIQQRRHLLISNEKISNFHTKPTHIRKPTRAGARTCTCACISQLPLQTMTTDIVKSFPSKYILLR